MAQDSPIEWCDATVMTDRNGRRSRIYRRKDKTRPGTQLRRQMRAKGKRWCRGCREWLASAAVSRQGVCLEHQREEYRRNYAAAPDAIRARAKARKRGIGPVSPELRELVFERFDGRCAYCPSPATTIDHVTPVFGGGRSVRGNLLPACASCNSSKKCSELGTFLARCKSPHDLIPDELCMEFIL